MDRIFSARVDESTVRRIGSLARRLNVTKKQVLESAIEEYANKLEREAGVDVLRETSGAWQRDESAAETAKHARETFRRSMERHRR